MTAVSVIVCTRDRRDSLVRCMESVLRSAQAVDARVELVVVDDGSLDGTPEAVAGVARRSEPVAVRSVRQGRLGLSKARNAGVRAAAGDILAFVDDDCVVSVEYLGEMITRFARDRGPVLRGGRVLLGDPQDAPLTIRPSTETERLSLRADVGGFILGCNMAMRPRVLERLGLFDERLGAGTRLKAAEDTDLIIRALLADIPVEFTGDMTVMHFHGRRTRRQVRAAHRNYNIGNGALMAKHLKDAPWFLLNGFWSARNALREAVGGPMFDDELEFSHGPIVLHNLQGLALFSLMKLLALARPAKSGQAEADAGAAGDLPAADAAS